MTCIWSSSPLGRAIKLHHEFPSNYRNPTELHQYDPIKRKYGESQPSNLLQVEEIDPRWWNARRNSQMRGGSTGGVTGCGATKLRGLTISLAAPPGISRELLATGSLDRSLVSSSIPTGFLVLMKRLRGAGAGAGSVGPGMMGSWVELPALFHVDRPIHIGAGGADVEPVYYRSPTLLRSILQSFPCRSEYPTPASAGTSAVFWSA